ncbi:MAG: aldo/keto reductase [Pseudomonadota bacterium]
MINRRQVMQLGASLAALGTTGVRAAAPVEDDLITRPIPSSGERVPIIGMGTSRTFDTGGDAESVQQLADVMQAFFAGRGTVIDSSPMYGSAESRVGDVLRRMAESPQVFAATKVWTTGESEGIEQMETSAQRMNIEVFDLIAIHNLQDWRTHLATLKDWKEEGKVRYIGITTSHGRDHEELLDIMASEPLDFVQFSYNIEDRVAEERLLPLSAERGIATMINRPYQRGSLFGRSRGKPLPDVAGDIDCESWAQFYLKWIMGHPAATCVIPATSKVHHMQDNMQANFGRLPDTAQREEMSRVFTAL